MKIEKINDRQIRCVLTKEDLESRKIRLSELVCGGEKARGLLRDMVIRAARELNFSFNNNPLMIEAVPTGKDQLVLIITRVDDPGELKSRFHQLTGFGGSGKTEGDQKSAEGSAMPAFSSADDILKLLRRFSKELEELKGTSSEQDPEVSDAGALTAGVDGTLEAGTAAKSGARLGVDGRPEDGAVSEAKGMSEDGAVSEANGMSEDGAVSEVKGRPVSDAGGRSEGGAVPDASGRSEGGAVSEAGGRPEGGAVPDAGGRPEGGAVSDAGGRSEGGAVSEADRMPEEGVVSGRLVSAGVSAKGVSASRGGNGLFAAGQGAGALAPGKEPKHPHGTDRSREAIEKEMYRYTRFYLFRSLEHVLDASKRVPEGYSGENTLYKNPDDGAFYLLVRKADTNAEQFNRICNVLSEYSMPMDYSTGMDEFFREHMRVIVADSALQHLRAV